MHKMTMTINRRGCKLLMEIYIFFPLENVFTKDSLPAFHLILPSFCSLDIACASGTALPVLSPLSASPPVFSPAVHNRCSMTFDPPRPLLGARISPHINSYAGGKRRGVTESISQAVILAVARAHTCTKAPHWTDISGRSR